MKSRATEYEALLTSIERMVRMARYWGERSRETNPLELDKQMMQPSLREASRFCDGQAATLVDQADAATDGSAFERTAAIWFSAHKLAVDWFRSGLPKVSIGSRHAAALMCTRMPSDVAPELRMPWSAFAIDIPEDVGAELYGLPVRQVFVHRSTTHDDFLGFFEELGEIKVSFCVASPRQDMFDVPVPVSAVADLRQLAERAEQFDDESHRGSSALMLLALGVIAELNQPRESAAIAHGTSKPRLNRRGESIVSTFALSRDIKVDCREAVREYMRGARGTSPTVQSLVRGHWKKQPCGTARSDRRLIFVEPYWRGPETAPIALRAHSIGHREEVSR